MTSETTPIKKNSGTRAPAPPPEAESELTLPITVGDPNAAASS